MDEPRLPDLECWRCECGKVSDRANPLVPDPSANILIEVMVPGVSSHPELYLRNRYLQPLQKWFGVHFCNCPCANKHHFYINWAAAAGMAQLRVGEGG